MNESKITKGCPKCGRVLNSDVDVCPYCNYKFDKLKAYYTRIEDQKYKQSGKYAGLLKRLVSFLADFIFIFLILMVTFISLVLTEVSINIPSYGYIAIFIIVLALYKVILEGFLSTTLGKKIVGIKLECSDGSKIGFGKALIRNVSIVLDVITLGIGYFTILFTKDKVALHDMVAKTVVVNEQNEVLPNDYAPGVMRLLAFILDGSILFGIWYLINLGINYVTEIYIINPDILMYRYYIEYGFMAIFTVIYFAIGESGSRGASIGKRVLGMRIEDYNGHRMSFIKAIFRTLFLIVEVVTLGFMLCVVSDRRQTLKDRIVDTVVIRI